MAGTVRAHQARQTMVLESRICFKLTDMFDSSSSICRESPAAMGLLFALFCGINIIQLSPVARAKVSRFSLRGIRLVGNAAMRRLFNYVKLGWRLISNGQVGVAKGQAAGDDESFDCNPLCSESCQRTRTPDDFINSKLNRALRTQPETLIGTVYLEHAWNLLGLKFSQDFGLVFYFVIY